MIDADYISKRLANKGYDLVIGGVNDKGMFGKIINNFKSRKIYLYTLKLYNEEVDKDINCMYLDTTFDRTKEIYNNSDKILFLPGGTGSLSEILSMLEEKRTINSDKEIIIYNQDGYYYDLIKFITKLIKNKFNDISILNYIKIFNDKDDLIKYLEV